MLKRIRLATGSGVPVHTPPGSRGRAARAAGLSSGGSLGQDTLHVPGCLRCPGMIAHLAQQGGLGLSHVPHFVQDSQLSLMPRRPAVHGSLDDCAFLPGPARPPPLCLQVNRRVPSPNRYISDAKFCFCKNNKRIITSWSCINPFLSLCARELAANASIACRAIALQSVLSLTPLCWASQQGCPRGFQGRVSTCREPRQRNLAWSCRPLRGLTQRG